MLMTSNHSGDAGAILWYGMQGGAGDVGDAQGAAGVGEVREM